MIHRALYGKPLYVRALAGIMAGALAFLLMLDRDWPAGVGNSGCDSQMQRERTFDRLYVPQHR